MNMDSIHFGAIPGQLIIWGIVLVLGLGLLIWAFNFLSIFIRAAVSGAPVGVFELIALALRKVPVGMVVDSRITAIKSGLDVSIDDLSTHYISSVDLFYRRQCRNGGAGADCCAQSEYSSGL